MYSRASEPRRAHVLEALELVSRPLTPVTRARSTGMQPERPGAVRRIGEERANAVDLVALDVHQEHVGRVGATTCDRELLEQARLQRPDADDEEGAEADGEQDRRASGCPGRDRCSTAWRSGNDGRAPAA